MIGPEKPQVFPDDKIYNEDTSQLFHQRWTSKVFPVSPGQKPPYVFDKVPQLVINTIT
jgi:hypothetical protein